MSLSTVIVGCGNIAKSYATDLKTYPEIRLAGFCDLDPARARAFADEHGGTAYETLDAVLADPAVPLIVNLTIHHAHEDVITRCLEAGKHVHTEKPLALTAASAARLARQANERGLRLSCAPTTWLGGPQQAVAEVLRSGQLGTVRQIYAEINHGRIESWHPNPAPFYEVGVLWDVCIYPVTLLTAFLGRVRSVQATARTLLPDRVAKDGTPFRIGRPDFYTALLDFDMGATARLTGSFYGLASRQGSSVEFHGDRGSLRLDSSFSFDAAVELTAEGQSAITVPPANPAKPGVEFARGVQDLAQALAENRPHRASAENAVHVIALFEAIESSVARGGLPVLV